MPHRLKIPESISVLGSLRALTPHRRAPFAELLRVAERQANLLLTLRGIDLPPTPAEIISELPKIIVEYTGSLVYGASFWDASRQSWIIQLPRSEPPEHNRFTLAHEFKHIVDHGRQTQLYRGTARTNPSTQAEQAADYFAGCLLVPRRQLKALWKNGITTTGELAEIFRVSEYTIGSRLQQTGLASREHLRHLPSPMPIIQDEEDQASEDNQPAQAEEGALPA
ncbi:ImmA/IrrE family metallo-endopeptidase [Mycolicibacterium cosmeticum]|uniref:ImmA/IrrE family metallo-endopeptidase n=1 Tax=Mycolicibacterium cosmeticum TaxID=258533 RepID=UPI00320477CF